MFIDGIRIESDDADLSVVTEAATGRPIGGVPRGTEKDVDRAVDAARRAFPAWESTPVAARAAVLHAIADGLGARHAELAQLIAREVGTPIGESERVQVDLPVAVLRSMADLAVAELADQRLGNSLIVRRAAGVVAAITPWNYPLYQIVAKVAAALAAGCTVVVKPSTTAPLSALVLAEVAAEAGLPPGVLNVVTGAGATVGELLGAHPGVDMVSLTGSVPAGVRIAQIAAADIKRVVLELGGKSANVLCADADLDAAIPAAVRSCFINNGQTCAALTRLLVPRQLLDEVEQRLVAAVSALTVGDPLDPQTAIGPLASAGQQRSVATYLAIGATEGMVLVGGPDPIAGLEAGNYVRPTVISRLEPDATVSREEIFGPALAVIPVRDIDEAVRVANDSEYGLSGGVWAGDVADALAVARRMRTGQVAVNGGRFNLLAPFGGYRRSGNGRELGPHGLAEYTELTSFQLPRN